MDDETTPAQGLPETIDELRNVIDNSLRAFFLSAAWAASIEIGVDQTACPSERIFPEGWRPKIFLTDQPAERTLERKNLYQFLLRAIVRDCGQYVEHFMTVADGGRTPKWSKTADPIYVLRVLRNSFNHNWTIGDVHRDVAWQGIDFRKTTSGSSPPKGFRGTDSILPRINGEDGAIETIGLIMRGVVDALENDPKFNHKSST